MARLIPTVRPYRQGDALLVASREGESTVPLYTDAQALAGPAYTAMLGERILGCAGVVLVWPGVGMAWMMVGTGICPYGLWLTRIVKRFLRDIVRAYGLHRLEAWALADSTCNQRWLEALAFTPEGGRARAYLSDRRDVIRYERIEGV